MGKSYSSEQKLIDIMFEVAIKSARHMQGKTNEEIARWVARNLYECGYLTIPMGMSWGVLRYDQSDTRKLCIGEGIDA